MTESIVKELAEALVSAAGEPNDDLYDRIIPHLQSFTSVRTFKRYIRKLKIAPYSVNLFAFKLSGWSNTLSHAKELHNFLFARWKKRTVCKTHGSDTHQRVVFLILGPKLSIAYANGRAAHALARATGNKAHVTVQIL